MNRSATFVLIGTLAVVLSACVASGGGLGPVPTAVPTPSGSPAGPDLTPIPTSSADPTGSPTSTPGASGSPSPTGSPAPTDDPGSGKTIVRAYFVLGGERRSEGLVPVLREVPETAGVARAAINALLAGPTPSESGDGAVSSAIPDGSRLLGIDIKNGIATVDLSTEFDSGGGSASMQYRLAQVVYTLTQFSTVKSVVFQIEGTTVTVFGSEGIVLAGPVGRGDFTDQLPSIFVDRPAYGAALGNPGRVTGNANVFEAAFLISLLDAKGRILVDEPVMALCGTGCRGGFDVTLRYTVGKAQWGILRTYNFSAADGSVEDVREYPVWLTPEG